MRLLACQAAAAAALLAGGVVAATFSSSFRKDAWLEDYVEPLVPLPLSGGRLHVVGAAAASGASARVYINGSLVDVSAPGSGDPAAWPVDWLRLEPASGLTAGAPFWLSFHSRSGAWDTLAPQATVEVRVEDAAGVALIAGNFSAAVPPVRVTWATTAGGRAALLLYLHNDGAVDVGGLASAHVNGEDVTAFVPAAARAVPAGGTVLWQLPAAAVRGGVAPGTVWTLEATWASGAAVATAAGGLLWPEVFPIEAWPRGADCPFPTVNDTAYALHRAHGIDTFFTEATLDSACNSSLTAVDIVNVLAPAHGFWVLPSFESGEYAGINDTSRLTGVFLADEDDTVVDAKVRTLLAAVATARAALPGVPTYAGGASNRYTGAYAGVADVKGMDAYIGACSPHYALLAMPARGSYDYLANTRSNHAPGPTWLYSQGFFGGWDSKLVGNRQADAAEIAVQVASVPAAGAKGLMLFETQLSYLGDPVTAPAWATLGTLLREIGALRELYRAGDATGMAAALDAGGAPAAAVIAEAVLSPRAAVLLLINTRAVNDTYNDICCGLDLAACHFTFVPALVAAATLSLPAGATVVDSFEVFNATVLSGSLPLAPPPAGSNASLALLSVGLGVQGPGSAPCAAPADAIVRTFVFAFDAQLRADVAAALVAPGGAPAPALLLLPDAATTASSGPASAAAAAPAENASPAAAAAAPVTIASWLSARDTGERLAPQPGRSFSATACPAPAPGDNATLLVTVNASAPRQTLLWGFGGAVTEAAVTVFGKLAPADQAAVLELLYGEAADNSSLRYAAGRLTIGSCDFALGYYNYAETPGDANMSAFSIAHDEAAIIPFLRRAEAAAAAAGRALEFIAAPWSPPAWMKSNYPLNNYTITAMSCFPLGPLDCALETQWQPAYALYFSKYLSAYRAAGVNVTAVSVQNEPQPQTGTLTYEGLWLPGVAAAQFVAEHLGPRLRADHPGVKIYVFDHNQGDALVYVAPILADPAAAQYVDGIAYHWYSGPDWSALQEMHALWPATPQLATEATAALGTGPSWWRTPDWAVGEYYGTFILNDLNAWSTGFLDWNILLDHNGGPDHGDPTGELCEGLVPCGSNAMLIVDDTVSPPSVYRQAFYWHMAHVSRWAPRGSVVVDAHTAIGAAGGPPPDYLIAAALVTPDGGTTLVLLNAGNTSVPVCVQDAGAGGSASAVLPPHSVQTWRY